MPGCVPELGWLVSFPLDMRANAWGKRRSGVRRLRGPGNWFSVVGALAVIVVEFVGLVFRVVMGAVAAPKNHTEKGEHED